MAVGAVAVVGTGSVGLDLIENVVARRFPVCLHDPSRSSPETVRASLAAAVGDARQKGRIDRETGETILTAVETDPADLRLDECDLVLEALDGRLHDKLRVLRGLQERMSPGAILASCSATIPVPLYARRLPRPEQFLALGLTPPLRRFPRVALRTSDRTAPGVTEATRYFFRGLGAAPREEREGSLSGMAAVPVGWDGAAVAVPASPTFRPAGLYDGE